MVNATVMEKTLIWLHKFLKHKTCTYSLDMMIENVLKEVLSILRSFRKSNKKKCTSSSILEFNWIHTFFLANSPLSDIANRSSQTLRKRNSSFFQMGPEIAFASIPRLKRTQMDSNERKCVIVKERERRRKCCKCTIGFRCNFVRLERSATKASVFRYETISRNHHRL